MKPQILLKKVDSPEDVKKIPSDLEKFSGFSFLSNGSLPENVHILSLEEWSSTPG